MKNEKKKKPSGYTTVRIWPKTREKLRVASALTGKSMVAVMDEIVKKYLNSKLPPGGVC